MENRQDRGLEINLAAGFGGQTGSVPSQGKVQAATEVRRFRARATAPSGSPSHPTTRSTPSTKKVGKRRMRWRRTLQKPNKD
jgi:hypothetical protein